MLPILYNANLIILSKLDEQQLSQLRKVAKEIACAALRYPQVAKLDPTCVIAYSNCCIGIIKRSRVQVIIL